MWSIKNIKVIIENYKNWKIKFLNLNCVVVFLIGMNRIIKYNMFNINKINYIII